MTVCPLDSESAKSRSLGTTAMTSVPVTRANLSTISDSPSTPRQLSTIPSSLGLPLSKFSRPRMMLLAAYIAMNSPDVTSITASAYSSLSGTANPSP